jgi:ABC-type multidrug transport system fused ATPase/permease subunit
VIAASIALLIAFGWLLEAGGLPLLPPPGTLARIEPTYLAAFVFAMVFSMSTRFARFYYLIMPIARVSLRRILTINAIGMALVTFLPLRIGEVARPAMLREKGRLSAWAVAGTVGAERILDGLVFSVMLIAGFWLSPPHDPLPDHIGALPVPASLVPHAAKLACAVFGAAFVVMTVFYAFRAFARRVTERIVGTISVSLGHRISDIVERLSDGLGFLVNVRVAAPYLAVTLVSIASQIWAVEILARAVGLPEVTFSRSMVVLGVVALGLAMPNAPGFFGTVQLALYAGLAAYVAPEKVAHEGAALVFVFYVTYLVTIIVLAALALIVESAAPTSTPIANRRRPQVRGAR